MNRIEGEDPNPLITDKMIEQNKEAFPVQAPAGTQGLFDIERMNWALGCEYIEVPAGKTKEETKVILTELSKQLNNKVPKKVP